MPRVYFDADIDPAPLRRCRIAVIGYGAQGRAQALNLRDSGCDVVVGLRPRSGHRANARRDRVRVAEIAAAARLADLVMMLVPDEAQGALYRDVVAPAMKPGAALGFSHGFAVHFGDIPRRRGQSGPSPREFILVAPKGPGTTLRRLYGEGKGLPALVAAEPASSSRAWALALAYAAAIGSGRAGILRTTFRDETVTDLFGEQAVLTGGMAELARAAFETLVARGYPPEVAYIECVQEVRGLAEVIFERGVAGMREVISSPAAWGGLRSGRALVDRGVRARLAAILDDVEAGGTRRYLRRLTPADKRALHARERAMPMERTGRWVRRTLRWSGTEEPAKSSRVRGRATAQGRRARRLRNPKGA